MAMANLTDLVVAEVSLVERPANRRKFLLFKSEEGEGVEDLKKAGPAPAEARGETAAAAEQPARPAEAIRAALGVLEEHKAGLSADILDGLRILAGHQDEPMLGKGAPHTDRGHEPRKSEHAGDAQGAGLDLSIVPEDLRAKMEALIKQGENAEKRARELEEEKRLREFIEKARTSYPHLAASPEEVGRLLKDAEDRLSAEARGFLERLIKSADSALAQALQPAGSSLEAEKTASAWDKIEKAAAHLVSEAGITRPQAIRKVLEAQPELYREYLSEKEGR